MEATSGSPASKADQQSNATEEAITDTADSPENSDPPAVYGRLLFAGGLFALAVRNLADLDGRIAYAGAKGVPRPDALVPAASGLLLGGSFGIGLWKRPRLSAGSVAAFFLCVTPIMHDFWAIDDESHDQELTSFLQNVTLFGAAVAFLSRAGDNE